eukprot:scaffold2617_cov122-Skeletonema_dohrnii-CCMP3373.AAC.3
MCGIGLLLSLPGSGELSSALISHLNQQLSETLSSRGPDVPCGKERCFGCDDDNGNLTLHASVLHMRGELPTPQPMLLNNNCAFCWNGECYSYNNSDVEESSSSERDNNMIELTAIGNEESVITSDTDLVANMLQDALNKNEAADNNNSHIKIIAEVTSKIHGEYAFILFVPSKSPNSPPYVYYGRDPLGRRSLLINKSIDGAVLLSSVAVNISDSTLTTRADSEGAQEWVEIPPSIVYRMDLQTGDIASEPIPRVINRKIPQVIELSKQTNDTMNFMQLLDRAVERRVAHAPSSHSNTDDASVAVLFSGGIDSVVLAALSHRHVPPTQPIDLINVSFFNDSVDGNSQGLLTQSPDRLAAILSYNEMQARFPERTWRFVAVDVKYREVLDHENRIRRLICPLESTMDFNIATAFWFAARGKGRLLGSKEVEDVQRELNIDEASMDNKASATSSHQPLLRFARHDGDDKKDRNRATSSKQHAQPCIREGCSRRSQSGCIFHSCKFCCGKFQGPISSFLGKSARLCPTHNHKQDGKAKGSEAKTSTKMKKQSMTIDRPCSDKNTITSSAKILISGVGADEQLAGYGRHRTTYQRGGYDALQSELKMEVGRLWTRNLGRDDRCLSDHGKEARFPFLDEDVVAYLERLPVDRKCDMTEAPGVGDKLLLREVARMIGVHSCSTLVKRAIQFGSRIAKVSDRSRFGSCRRATGTASIRSNHRDVGLVASTEGV